MKCGRSHRPCSHRLVIFIIDGARMTDLNAIESKIVGELGIRGAMQVAATLLRGAYESSIAQPWENFTRLLNPLPWEPAVSLREKRAFVTGATNGIGLATATMLATHGAHVFIGCRSKDRGLRAREKIMEEAGEEALVEVVSLDLASLDSVRDCIKGVNRRKLKFDLVVLNAGISPEGERQESCDKIELCLQSNWLGHMLLVHGLLEGMKVPGGSEDGSKPSTRFVWLSSVAHYCGSLKLKDLQSKTYYSPFLTYGLSKFLCTSSAIEMQRRFSRSAHLRECTSISVHPGIVDTSLALHFLTKTTGSFLFGPLRHAFASLVQLARRSIMRSSQQGAETVLFASLAPRRLISSGYLVPPSHSSDPHPAAKDEKVANDVWDFARRLTGVDFDSIYIPDRSKRQFY